MGRVMRTTGRKAAFLALAGLVASCAREDIGAARYGADDCRRVALVDAATGAAVRGAEDLALDLEGGRLFVSAYDRRAVEKAAARKAATLPQGGLYAVSLGVLFDPQTDEVKTASLANPADFAGGLRPHGVSYDPENHELVFVNRTYAREGRAWKMTPRLQRIGANGEVYVGAPRAVHCAANDVAADGQRVFASFDHGSCGVGAGLENVFGLKRSGVARDGETLFGNARFANGLARRSNGDLVMAATREDALIVLDGEAFSERARIALPGGPDNLTLADDGGVIAATHPSLFSLMLNRKFGARTAPSRIVKADIESGVVDILFDDPSGKIFSAATAAVETEAGLVAGSVTDEGLLVCRAAS